ncbi:MAG: hypothetical protein ACKVQS_02580 [Fimbriimonadaceae bacterium]
MSNRWPHFRYSYNRRPVVYHGINLWSFAWKPTGIESDLIVPGESVPISVPIYEIRHRGRTLFFAAFEIMPEYWLFAAKDDPFDSEGCTANPNPEPPRLSHYERPREQNCAHCP